MLRNATIVLAGWIFCSLGAGLLASEADWDEDGLRNEVETGTGVYVSPQNTGTNPYAADSDGDSVPDAIEVRMGTDPNRSQSRPKRPNIIYILVDDLGYGDVGCFWQNQKTGTMKFATPGLDRMAGQGAMLTNHYVGASICAPSRASLLQGRHQGHADVRDLQFDAPLPKNHTMAQMLKDAGYFTVHIGKAGLTGKDVNKPTAHPLERGFQRFFGYLLHEQAHEHYPRNGNNTKGAYLYDDYRKVTDAYVDVFTSDVYTAFAKKTLRDQTQRNPDQPFFIYLAYDTPHFNNQYPPTATYPSGSGVNGGLQWTGAPSYVNTAINSADRVNHPANVYPTLPSSWGADSKPFVSMVKRIDDSVADLLQTLRDLSIDRDTLVVFTSDNGPEPIGIYPPNFQSYGGLQGVKGDLLEGGIRTPTIVWWPGSVPASGSESAPRKVEAPMANYDWMATFAEMARVEAPAFTDGISMLPTLCGKAGQKARDYLYFEMYMYGTTPTYPDFPTRGGRARNQMQAVRVGDYMGIRMDIQNADQDFEIFDVVKDARQTVNLAAGMPAMQSRMKSIAVSSRRPLATAPRPYDKVPMPATVPPGAVREGMEYARFEGHWSYLPKFRDMVPAETGYVSNFKTQLLQGRTDAGIEYRGYLKVETAGAYQFQLQSSSESALWIHDAHVIDNDYDHAATRTSGPVYLEAGLHPIRLAFRHQQGMPELRLLYTGPGLGWQPVPDQALMVDGAPPTIRPDEFVVAKGGSYLANVLGNDTSEIPLKVESVDSTLLGSIQLVGDQVAFSPAAGVLGKSKWKYTAVSGGKEYIGEVSGTVLFDDEIWIPFEEPGTAVVKVEGRGAGQRGELEGYEEVAQAWTGGRYGYCLRFDGVNDQATFPTLRPAMGSQARSLSAWICAPAAGGGEKQSIFSYGGVGDGERYTVRLMEVPGEPGKKVLGLEVGGGMIRGSKKLNDGLWHHVAVTLGDRDGDGDLMVGEARLYVDGEAEVFSGLQNRQVRTLAGLAPVVGGSNHDFGYHYRGRIDEIRWFERELTPQEVWDLRAAKVVYNELATDAMLDSDEDGMSDGDELVAGTDPWDARSVLRLEMAATAPGVWTLKWKGLATRSYVLEWSEDLTIWNQMAMGAEKARDLGGGAIEYAMAVARGSSKQRFFRLQADLAGGGSTGGSEEEAGGGETGAAVAMRVVAVSPTQIVFRWSGPAGKVYQLERSGNLRDWVVMPGLVPQVVTGGGEGGSAEYQLKVAREGAKQQFYRLRYD